jgi:hypothetical protein
MRTYSKSETLQRAHAALDSANTVLSGLTAGAIAAEYKAGHDPVTEADWAVDAVLRRICCGKEKAGYQYRSSKRHVQASSPFGNPAQLI